MAQKEIVIITLGGTILGEGKADSSVYHSGALSAIKLVEALTNELGIDTLESYLQTKLQAKLTLETLANIDSADMDSALLLQLAKAVESSLLKDNVCGVVIAQGTDTLEESAYFLHLLSTSQKPIVFTAAMRHLAALGSDAKRNFYHALCLASSPEAWDKGVLVVMNDCIISARDIRKNDTHSMGAFDKTHLGYMLEGKPYFRRYTAMPHTHLTAFSLQALESTYHTHHHAHAHSFDSSTQSDTIEPLPQVAILYGHQGSDLAIFTHALVESKIAGVVCACVGNGTLSKRDKLALIALQKHKAVPIVLSSRVAEGHIVLDSSSQASIIDSKNTESNKTDIDTIDSSELPQGAFISGSDLGAPKARILLMLALAHHFSPKQIAHAFATY